MSTNTAYAGMAVAVQHVRVRFAQRVGEQPVAHEPAVDEDVLCVAAAARLVGRAEVPAHAQTRRLRVELPARRGGSRRRELQPTLAAGGAAG